MDNDRARTSLALPSKALTDSSSSNQQQDVLCAQQAQSRRKRHRLIQNASPTNSSSSSTSSCPSNNTNTNSNQQVQQLARCARLTRKKMYHSDRFIPARYEMDFEYCEYLVREHEDSWLRDENLGGTTTSSSHSNLSACIHEIDRQVRYKETLAANLLHDRHSSWARIPTPPIITGASATTMTASSSSSRAINYNPPSGHRNLLPLHTNENVLSGFENCSPSFDPLVRFQLDGRYDASLWWQNNPTVCTRHIPSSPTRILDAPELRDDYYLNLVSWGDNNILAVALDQVVYLYNTETGMIQEIRACASRNDYVTSVAWVTTGSGGSDSSSISAHGDMLAIGTFSSELQVWDACSNTRVCSLLGHDERIGSLAWNGKCLASGSRDTKILFHDLRAANGLSGAGGRSRHRSNAICTLVGHHQEICGLAWSPDGKTLASGGNDNYLCLWDAKMTSSRIATPRQRLEQHEAAVKALAWCPWERNLLASGGGTADRTIKFWNANNGRLLTSVNTGSQVCGLVWSRNEKELLSSHGFSQNELCLWKYPSMVRMREFTGHTARVLHLAMSPDGSSVVSAAADETLRFWNVFASSKGTKKQNLKRSFLTKAVIR